MGLNIFVGTTSEAKNAYVKKCLDDRIDVGIITPIDVDSGVPDQPFDSETEEGAKNRARNAYKSGSSGSTRIGIGLEGGLTNIKDLLHLICAVSIYDGSKFFTHISEPLVLPESVSKKVKDGAEFGAEIRNYKPKKKEVNLVAELVSREKSFTDALDGAVDKYLHS